MISTQQEEEWIREWQKSCPSDVKASRWKLDGVKLRELALVRRNESLCAELDTGRMVDVIHSCIQSAACDIRLL